MNAIPAEARPLVPPTRAEGSSCWRNVSSYLFGKVSTCYHHQTTQKISRAVSSFFSHPVTLAGITALSAINIAVSGYFAGENIEEYAEECIDELNSFSGDLADCAKPHTTLIHSFQISLAISAVAIGYILQKYVQPYPPVNEGDESPSTSLTSFVRKSISALENKFSYESQLLLGYLYNGLWIDTTTVDSWSSYFKMQTAAIGIAAVFLGMFSRAKHLKLLAFFDNRTATWDGNIAEYTYLRHHAKALSLQCTVGALSFVAMHVFGSNSPEAKMIKEISLCLAIRPLGRILRSWSVHQTHATDPAEGITIYTVLSGLLHMQSPMAIAGYYIYLQSPETAYRYGGALLVGFAQGVNQAAFVNHNQESLPPSSSNGNTLLKNIPLFIKHNIPTIALIGLAAVSKTTSFFDCYDVSTYNCPIGIELSHNYVNIDGQGINIMIYSGLSFYYTRLIFRKIINHKKIEKFAKGYLTLTDKMQFDVFMAVPYAILHSGKYIADYKSYASLNPPVALALLGASFAHYKERVNAEAKSDAAHPSFTRADILAIK